MMSVSLKSGLGRDSRSCVHGYLKVTSGLKADLHRCRNLPDHRNCNQSAAKGESARYSADDKDLLKVIAVARLKLESDKVLVLFFVFSEDPVAAQH